MILSTSGLHQFETCHHALFKRSIRGQYVFFTEKRDIEQSNSEKAWDRLDSVTFENLCTL